jgi:hemerythrin
MYNSSYKFAGGITMNIEFDNNLITGNATIDEQHKELISRIRQLVSSCENGDGKRKAIQMLDYLNEYTEFHFAAEEKLQEEAGYPEIEQHKKQHMEFKKTIEEMNDFLLESEGPTEQFISQIERDVVNWLFKHIKTFDRSVAEYISK